jgi:hypothetical protein
MLNDCLCCATRLKKSKWIWGIFMFVFWPFTAFFYGIFVAQKKMVKVLSWILFILFVSLTVLFTYFIIYHVEKVRIEIPDMILSLGQIDTSELSDEQVRELKNDLGILQGELTLNFSNFNKSMQAVRLIELFEDIKKDTAITGDEYVQWIEMFMARNKPGYQEIGQGFKRFKPGKRNR